MRTKPKRKQSLMKVSLGIIIVLGREISELSVVIKVELLENQEEIRYSL